MTWLAVLGLFVLLCGLLALLLPSPPPSRWWLRLQHGTTQLTGRLRRNAVPDPDPFDTLRLQTRLAYLATKIRRIESAPHVYARAHRLMALEAAYDDLLDEACRLAGCPDPLEQKRSEAKRWQEEQELAARGWTW